ncbi:NUDIX hydrolase [Methylocapsa sp. S129]|uniref:NUDIX hydrolase n=1 Tax=Methylocapsa sp. S129 TaxID=1641869 RepID=UPI00131C7DE7|nr:NUDIX hydrolase [Methylocapsa sp. S129]
MSEADARIFEVTELDLAYEPAPWAFAQSQADQIAAHWAQRKAALPLMFDGRVLLLGRHEFAKRNDGATILRGAYFETDFKAFLAWRDFGFPDAAVCNCFSMAALQSSDGAFLLGEMAAHTANAGSVYFAAGTPDPSDIFGDRVDLAASVRRELQEETGISPDEVAMGPEWTIVYAPPRIACMKIMRVAATAQSIKTRVDSFLADDLNAELRRMHIVRRAPDIETINCPRFIADFLRYALAGA